jgi:hypothetical protein
MADPETFARLVATEALNQAIVKNYLFYLIVAVISLTSGSIGAFFTAYFKKRGEDRATQDHFVELLGQLKETTTLSENIKKTLDEQQNFRVLLREKFESLFEQTFKLEQWLFETEEKASDGILPNRKASPMALIEMYFTIYFNDVRKEFEELRESVFQYNKYQFRVAVEGRLAKNEQRNPTFFEEHFDKVYQNFSDTLKNFRESLLKEYSSLLSIEPRRVVDGPSYTQRKRNNQNRR